MKRNRFKYALVVVAVVAAGLTSRSRYAACLPPFIAEYAGDTLWALTVFLALGWLFVRARTSALAVSALLIAYGVECSQLYQAPWFSALRETHVGALLLGSGFLWSDFVCYTAGIVAGAVAEYGMTRRNRRDSA